MHRVAFDHEQDAIAVSALAVEELTNIPPKGVGLGSKGAPFGKNS
jgi:hypothetical protein